MAEPQPVQPGPLYTREPPAEQPSEDRHDGQPEVLPVEIIPVAGGEYMQQPPAEPIRIQQPPVGNVQLIRQPAAGEVREIRQPPAGEVQEVRQPAAGEVQHIRQPPAGEIQQPEQPVLSTFAAPPAQEQPQQQVDSGQEEEEEEEESSEEESSEEDDDEEEEDEEEPNADVGEGPVRIQQGVVQTTSTARQQFVTFTEPTPQSPPPPLPSNGPPQEDKPVSRIPVARTSPGTVVTTQTVRTTSVTMTAPGPVPKAVMEEYIPDIDDESDEEEPLPSGGATKPADAAPAGSSSKETTL